MDTPWTICLWRRMNTIIAGIVANVVAAKTGFKVMGKLDTNVGIPVGSTMFSWDVMQIYGQMLLFHDKRKKKMVMAYIAALVRGKQIFHHN